MLEQQQRMRDLPRFQACGPTCDVYAIGVVREKVYDWMRSCRRDGADITIPHDLRIHSQGAALALAGVVDELNDLLAHLSHCGTAPEEYDPEQENDAFPF